MKLIQAVPAAMLLVVGAEAAPTPQPSSMISGWVVTTCGADPLTAGKQGVLEFLPDGSLCVTLAPGSAVSSKPGMRTIVALDVAVVTTGGQAVTALNAGNRTAGGWLHNPGSATINLCINEQGVASGTTSSNATTCIIPGQTYTLVAAAGPVSVISSDSAHVFSGLGLQ